MRKPILLLFLACLSFSPSIGKEPSSLAILNRAIAEYRFFVNLSASHFIRIGAGTFEDDLKLEDYPELREALEDIQTRKGRALLEAQEQHILAPKE